MFKHIELNKRKDIIIREEPDSGSEWSDMSTDDEDEVDPLSVDVQSIRNQMESAKRQAEIVDTTGKLTIFIYISKMSPYS